MPAARLPLVGTVTDRDGSSSKDQRFYNCFPESLGRQHLFVSKRPGMQEEYAETAGAGRGITTFEGNLYYIIGDTIYKNGSALGSTLNSSSGRCYFARRGGGTPLLIINDKSDLYTLNTSDTLTTISDGDYPTSTVAGVEHLDQYVFVMDNDGIIYNSNVNDPTAWDATDFLTAEVISDVGVRLIRHVNYIMALSAGSVEFFYDAANATGSPLSRLEGTVSLIGCSAGDTAVNIGQEVLWVARDQGGGNYVAKLTGFTPEPISIKPVEEALNLAGSNVSNCWAYPVRIMGHNFYVLTIPDSSVKQTWVYDLTDKIWHQWTSWDGSTESYFTGIDSTFYNGEVLIQDEDNGKVYHMSPSVYEDDGNAIKVRGITERFDGGMVRNKFLHRLELISDRNVDTSGTLRIRWSDDDYVNFSEWRHLDVYNPSSHITRGGRFKRRAFEYRFEENAPLRLEAFELDLGEGQYGL